MKKAVNHALGRNLQDGGQCMSNGFQLLLSTTTVASVHQFLRCARTLQKKCWYSLRLVRFELTETQVLPVAALKSL